MVYNPIVINNESIELAKMIKANTSSIFLLSDMILLTCYLVLRVRSMKRSLQYKDLNTFLLSVVLPPVIIPVILFITL